METADYDSLKSQYQSYFRQEELAGEKRINRIRLAALLAFFLSELLAFHYFRSVDIRFHIRMNLIFAGAAVQAIALHAATNRRGILTERMKAAAVMFDIFWLTLYLLIADGPSSYVVSLYYLVITASGLRYRSNSVWLTTIACIASYAVVNAEAAIKRPQFSVPTDETIDNVIIMALLGVLTGFIAGRLKALLFRFINETREKEHYMALSIRDKLTGLFNHRHFHEVLQQEIERAKRYNNPLSLLLIDIDDFKRYNDMAGHLAGDKLLSELGALLSGAVRKADIAARYGGEELAVIMPHADKKSAGELAQRILVLIRQKRFLRDISEVGHHVTISIGIASFPDDAGEKSKFIENADRALYQAKHLGKNQTCLFTPHLQNIHPAPSGY